MYCESNGEVCKLQCTMSNVSKEVSIKLIPSEPMTNTMLIIYCVSGSGASLPYKCIWRKFNHRRNRMEELRNNNESSYRCSPLDIDCTIEVVVTYQQDHSQVTQVVQSKQVKASRQLKQNRMYFREPIQACLKIEQLTLQVKVIVEDMNIHIIGFRGIQPVAYVLSILDILAQSDNSQTSFRLIFKRKIQDFSNFIEHISGWRAQLKSNSLIMAFPNDVNRDIILLGIAEALLKMPNISQKPIQPTKFPDRQQNSKVNLDMSQNNINSKLPSYSPTASYRQKAKNNQTIDLKRSFTNIQKKPTQMAKITSPEPKPSPIGKNNEKSREYLNVFQEDQLELLSTHTTPSEPKKVKHLQSMPSDNPSINLRGSFEELQKSFNSNLNDDAIDRVFGMETPSAADKKNADEIERLKKQNEQLRKQLQNVSLLLKQNQNIKKKYHELKQQISKLQQQRTTILADKLRCEVNWHKQLQEKQVLKKQLEFYKGSFQTQRLKTTSFHESARFKQFRGREANHSPNSVYHYK